MKTLEQLQADFNNPDIGTQTENKALFRIEALPGENNTDPILVFTCKQSFNICQHLSKEFMEELLRVARLANFSNNQ